MIGVTINGLHSYNDLGFYMESYEIQPPSVQTNEVIIQGRNGSLDLTESLGVLAYNNRQVSIALFAPIDRAYQMAKYRELMQLFHGREVEVVFDDDPTLTIKGRVVGTSMDRQPHLFKFNIIVNALPFRYLEQTTETKSVTTATQSVTLVNYGDVEVVPMVETTVGITITAGESVVHLSAGNYYVDAISIQPSDSITFTIAGDGTGTASFIYQGAVF